MFLSLISVGLIVAISAFSVQYSNLRAANTLANNNIARAEQSSARARLLASKSLDTAERVLSRVPKQVSNRLDLTNQAVQGFRELAQLNPRNADIRLDQAKSLLTRANLLKMTNKKSRAEADYLACIELLQGLQRDPKHGEMARGNLVEALIYYGKYLQAGAHLQEARRQLERAGKLLESLPDHGGLSFQWSQARYQSALG